MFASLHLLIHLLFLFEGHRGLLTYHSDVAFFTHILHTVIIISVPSSQPHYYIVIIRWFDQNIRLLCISPAHSFLSLHSDVQSKIWSWFSSHIFHHTALKFTSGITSTTSHTTCTGWPIRSVTIFCWLWFGSSTMLPTCHANSARFAAAQA